MSSPTSKPLPVSSPRGLVRINASCSPVLDADDEVFELYSELSLRGSAVGAGTVDATGSGLGFLDGTKDVLELELEIVDPRSDPPRAAAPTSTDVRVRSPELVPSLSLSPQHRAPRLKRTASHQKEGKGTDSAVIVSASIAQDLGALRNRKGDTGSVIWRSSLLLARRILAQHLFPSPLGDPNCPRIVDRSTAARTHVLELGCGTGILPVLLQRPERPAPSAKKGGKAATSEEGMGGLFRSWTATDRLDNLRLVERNIRLNGTLRTTTAELDWESLPRRWAGGAGHYQTASTAQSRGDGHDRDARAGDRDSHFPGLILAVDCLYNEALVAPFVRTLELCASGETTVLVLVELRSSDVIQLFLETWLASRSAGCSGQGTTTWAIHRLSEEYVGRALGVRSGFVAWVGWKVDA